MNTSTSSSPTKESDDRKIPKIPVEIISDEEMALIDAAFAAYETPLARLSTSPRSIRSITLLSKCGLSACGNKGPSDIEDCDRVIGSDSPQKNKSKGVDSFLNRFRRARGLAVTDLTATEWCQKQMEFTLLMGRAEKSKAMKVGSARHAELEEEVIRRVKVNVESAEDVLAIKFMNFIVGINQLLFDGLTRELPLVACVEGVWMVGIIDEIRMPLSGAQRSPMLVDTKTRVRPTLPSEPQRRNGKLQLMCYKYMWDNLVTQKFPSTKFFDFFSLNPNKILSPDIRDTASKSGLSSKTLGDVVRCFENSCCLLPQADEHLLLRYELQEDRSLLEEDNFVYDSEWVEAQIKLQLEFWLGLSEPSYVPDEERWKCRYCAFSSKCQAISSPDASTKQPENVESETPCASN